MCKLYLYLHHRFISILFFPVVPNSIYFYIDANFLYLNFMRKKIEIPNDVNGKAGNTYFLHVVPSSYSNSTYYNIDEEYAVNVNGIPSFICRILKIKTVSELNDATTLLSHGITAIDFIKKFEKPQYYILLCKRIK